MASKLTTMVLLKFCLFSLAFALHVSKLRCENIESNFKESLIVRTRNGVVEGTIDTNIVGNKRFLAWRGIPYAKPPVGALRFKPPEPASDWIGVREAINDGSSCVQKIPRKGQEDCLFINVYTPKLQRDGNLLPVLVWIYGGAFINGNSFYDNYGPDYFLNEGVMFVSFNYRLGIFGFLSTDDMASPGNYGLKDQIFALKWIQDNIRAFGGDPQKVTIFGESAGAASVSYLVQTPLAKGLFRAAISNSGSALSQWALTKNNEITAMIADSLDVDKSTSSSLVEGLRKVNFRLLHLFSTIYSFPSYGNVLHGLVYSPTYEPPHQEAVVTGRNHQLAQEGRFNRVPYLMGFNSEEAAGVLNAKPLRYLNLSKLIYLHRYDKNNADLIPESMNVNTSDRQTVAASIRQRYFEDSEPIASSPREIECFASDDQFVRPILESASLHAVHAPVYLYRFSYLGGLRDPLLGKRLPNQGVTHGEDLYYLFKRKDSKSTTSNAEILTRNRVVRMWSNFVKHGNPTPAKDALLENITWPITRASSDIARMAYLDIGDHLQVLENPREEYMSFWQYLFQKYGNPPYDTY